MTVCTFLPENFRATFARMERLVDIHELARLTAIKAATLRKYVARKKMPCVKVGRLVRFRLSDIEKWIRACPGGTDGEKTADADGGGQGELFADSGAQTGEETS
jgi:excisionase family DNA binding protein